MHDLDLRTAGGNTVLWQCQNKACHDRKRKHATVFKGDRQGPCHKFWHKKTFCTEVCTDDKYSLLFKVDVWEAQKRQKGLCGGTTR